MRKIPCSGRLRSTTSGTVPRSSPTSTVRWRWDSSVIEGVELLGRVVDVGALGRRPARRYPEQAVERHDVVDPQHARGAHGRRQHPAQILVAVPALALRVERREAPALAADEERVRRRTGRGVGGEQLPVAPEVVGVPVDAQGQVEVEAPSCRVDRADRADPAGAASRLRALGDPAHLGVGEPLDVEVIAPGRLVLRPGLVPVPVAVPVPGRELGSSRGRSPPRSVRARKAAYSSASGRPRRKRSISTARPPAAPPVRPPPVDPPRPKAASASAPSTRRLAWAASR